MGVATWDFAITNMPTLATAASILDFLEKPARATYTRRRNSYCELVIEVNNENDLHMLAVAGYRRCILAYRNGVERFFGQIVEHRETGAGMTIGARDPYYNLSWRRIQADVSYTSSGDAGIAADLIELQNSGNMDPENPGSPVVRPTWLIDGVIDNGTTRSLKFLKGDIVAEQIEAVADLPGGFAFTIDPVTYGTVGALSEFNTVSPYNVVRPKAVFSYGARTLDNVRDYEREMRPLVTRADVFGSDRDMAYALSLSGSATYGLWEDQRGHVTTEGITQLENVAAGYVDTVPLYDVKIEPGPNAPQIFTDFDVVHAVPVQLRRNGREILGDKPVTSVTISLDPDSGHEVFDEVVVDDEDEP